MSERVEVPPERRIAQAGAAPEDVVAFLRACPPFDVLSVAEVERAAAALRIAYVPRGAGLNDASEDGGLYLLRMGAVDLRDAAGTLLDRLGEGDSLPVVPGEQCLIATVLEDALVYRLPLADWSALRGASRAFDRQFTRQRSRRLRRAARVAGPEPAIVGSVRELMSVDLLTVSPMLSVQATAAAMAERRVSSALVLDGSNLVGIVTDRDLRSRVVAPGLSGATPVGQVMSASPVTIAVDATLLDAMLRMTLRELHHLPVVEDGALVGMISSSDLVLARRDDPVHLVQHIARQSDAAGVAALVAQSGALAQRLAAADLPPGVVSQLLTAISDAAVRRLIALAEADLGPAPAPWAWLAFGSQGRREQLLGADQDNGIVIADGIGDSDRAWYASLARRVCDDLAACGYPYCPGAVMASTDTWRVTLGEWQATVRRWAHTPTADAVMRVSIFFDPRAVYGDGELVDALQQDMLREAGRNTIFLAALAAGVLEARPPLGIFRRFVVDRQGEHADRLDIKKQGVLPITEIVRLHALASGVAAVNTDERLAALSRRGHLALVDARNLGDALHCIQRIRLRHQGARVAEGRAPDNHVDPRALARLEREQLRDAFTIIHEAQAGVRQRYRAGLG